MADLFARFEGLKEKRDSLNAHGGPHPLSVKMDEILSQTEAMIEGRHTILAGTNNYLGLTFADGPMKAAHKAIDEAGTGTTGSRVANGTYYGHKDLEAELSRFLGKDDTIVFSTGYLANLGILANLMGPDDYILIDADSHASIYDGVRQAEAQVIRFKHNDAADLDKRLSRLDKKPGNKLVVIEGIYSMLGDKAPIQEIVDVKNKHANTYLLSDEAHSLGVLGEHGRGLPEEAGVEDDVDFIVGTFSKSAGTVGGFCASSVPGFDVMRLAMRQYIFTASLPPSVVASAKESIKLIEKSGALRQRLMRNAERLHAGLSAIGLELGGGVSPVVGVVAPTIEVGVVFWQHLLLNGVYVNLALPPATPNNKALLRCSLCAAHTEEQIDQIVATFAAVAQEMGLSTDAPAKAAAVG